MATSAGHPGSRFYTIEILDYYATAVLLGVAHGNP